MAEENAKPGSDAPAADDQGAQEAQNTDQAPAAGGDREQLTAEDARKLRSEANALRKRLKDAENQLTAREQAELSEKDKAEHAKEAAETRAAELEHEVRELRVQVLAPQAGIRPDATRAAYALLDWSEVDDPTDRKQVIKALKDVARDNPYLATGQTADGGATGGDHGGQATDMSDWIRRRTGRSLAS